MSRQMELKCMNLGSFMTNCYLVKNKTTGEMLLIDPGAYPERILQMVGSMEGTPAAILLTHGHFDHIGAVNELKERYPKLPVYIHEKEKALIQDPGENLSDDFGESFAVKPDVILQKDEELRLAGFLIRVLHTPGHTPGSCCYYFPEEGVLFSGDTLFAGSCGRTDFPGGSGRLMRESLEMLVTSLPEETEVYPGHDRFTSIGEEKRYNPFV